jgi:hypothetical protein
MYCGPALALGVVHEGRTLRKDLPAVWLVQSEQEIKRDELRAYVEVATTNLGMGFLNVSGAALNEN